MKASANNLAEYLGVPKYRYGEVEGKDLIGVVIGLAWTDVGGELLTIEAAMMPGKGRMMVTGNLRDVMKESISAAAAYVRSRAVAFGIEPPLFDKRDIHVHVPEGATPKDGPSAGVAMVTAIVSVMAGIPVRRDADRRELGFVPYHSYETAQRLDLATAQAIEQGDWVSLGSSEACGWLAVAGLLIESRRRGLEAFRLALCNSGDMAGSQDRVVGYGAWMFGKAE